MAGQPLLEADRAQEIEEPERLLEEFKEISDSKIGMKYLQKIVEKDELTDEQIHEIKVIANRPRLDPEVWAEIKDESTPEEIENEVEVMQGRWYDPFAAAMEIVQIEEERRLAKIEEIENKKVKKEIKVGSTIAASAGVLLGGVQIAQKGQIDVFQILAIVALVQICQFAKTMLKIQTKSLAQQKGGRQEMVRSRTQIGGNVVERLMQVCDKITFVERRCMEINGSYREFHRQLTQNVLEVNWYKLAHANIALKQQIGQFLAAKYRLGVRNFPEEFVGQFIQKMKVELQWTAEQAKTQKAKQFWLERKAEIDTQIRQMIREMDHTLMEA